MITMMAKREMKRGKADNILLNKLTHLTRQVARGNYTGARTLFELTKTAAV